MLSKIGFAFLAAGVLGLASPLAAQTALNATPLDELKYLSAQDQNALLSKPGPASVATYLSNHENYTSQLVERRTSGPVEVHQHWIDFITILSGTATLTYGGTLTGGTDRGLGETRGGTISGGKTIDLHPGDYVEMPVGVPHLVTLPSPGATIRYMVIKQRQ